jgi:hypothetical protein
MIISCKDVLEFGGGIISDMASIGLAVCMSGNSSYSCGLMLYGMNSMKSVDNAGLSKIYCTGSNGIC